MFASFQHFCTRRQLRPSSLLLLEYMLSKRLLKRSDIHHYVVLHEYRRLRQLHTYKNKTQTIRAIAHTYELHENTVWNILKDHKHKFESNIDEDGIQSRIDFSSDGAQ